MNTSSVIGQADGIPVLGSAPIANPARRPTGVPAIVAGGADTAAAERPAS